MATSLRNRLLDLYVQQAGPAILQRFESVPLPFKVELFRPGERPRYVHFVTSGLSSLLALMSEGSEVEVSMTGREGIPEAIYLLGPELSPRNCLMQIEGTGLRMPFAEFQKLFDEDSVMRRVVLRYVQYQSLVSAQLVACNSRHDAIERLSRWLLMVQDRVEGPDLPLTQEFLAQMLGSRRSTVTIAASHLQQAGLIDCRRGHIQIVDRDRLAETTCECYQLIQKLLESLHKN
jgi:CRP-like cAMP-binding protein